MTSSTYPGPYRATTAWRPPGPHTRVTTARDLGRALHRLHAGAHGDATALRLLGLSRRQAVVALRVLASAQPVGDNAGLLRPWLGGATVVEKNGWLSDTRTTATIVYDGGRATIVVVELYRPGVTYAEAKRLGRDVLDRGRPGLARRQGRRRGHQPGTERRYSSYCSPNCRRRVGSSYTRTKV